jgi:hypothetical protein
MNDILRSIRILQIQERELNLLNQGILSPTQGYSVKLNKTELVESVLNSVEDLLTAEVYTVQVLILLMTCKWKCQHDFPLMECPG